MFALPCNGGDGGKWHLLSYFYNTAVKLWPACLPAYLPFVCLPFYLPNFLFVCLLLVYFSLIDSSDYCHHLNCYIPTLIPTLILNLILFSSPFHSMMPNEQTDAASQAAKNIFSFAALSFKTAVEAGQVMTSLVCVWCVCICVCIYVYVCVCVCMCVFVCMCRMR